MSISVDHDVAYAYAYVYVCACMYASMYYYIGYRSPIQVQPITTSTLMYMCAPSKHTYCVATCSRRPNINANTKYINAWL